MVWLNKLMRKEDPAQFGQKVLEHLKRYSPEAKLQFTLESFRIDVLDDQGHSKQCMLLGNLYSEYQAASFANRPNVIKNCHLGRIDYAKCIPDTFEEARPHLLPRILPRAEWAAQGVFMSLERLAKASETKTETAEQNAEPDPTNQSNQSNGRPLLPGESSLNQSWQAINNFYAVGVCIDTPDSVVYVDAARILTWKISFEEALSQAKTNLNALSPAPSFDAYAEGVWVSNWHDTYDATRLILTDLIRQTSVRGAHVAMLPNRNSLIVTGSEDPLGLAVMLDAADYLAKQPRAIATIPLFLVGNEWREYEVPPDHPQFGRLKKLRIMAQAEGYAAQTEGLTQLFENMAVDIFVATYMVFEKGGRTMTMATWSDGVAAILPRADYIGLTDASGLVAAGKWERVQEIVGGALQRTEYFPERFYVDSFPSRAQLERIGNELK